MSRTIDTVNYSVDYIVFQLLLNVPVKREVVEYLVVECGIILVKVDPVHIFAVSSDEKLLLPCFRILEPELQGSLPVNRVGYLHVTLLVIVDTNRLFP